MLTANHQNRTVRPLNNLARDISQQVTAPSRRLGTRSDDHEIVITLFKLLQNLVGHQSVPKPDRGPHPKSLNDALFRMQIPRQGRVGSKKRLSVRLTPDQT